MQKSDLCFSELQCITLADKLSISLSEFCLQSARSLLARGQLVSQAHQLPPQLIHQCTLLLSLSPQQTVQFIYQLSFSVDCEVSYGYMLPVNMVEKFTTVGFL